MPDKWATVIKLCIAAMIALVVAFAFGTNKGMTLEERQRLFEKTTMDFERLCLDPSDPLITDADVNSMRVRLGLKPLSDPALRNIRTRLGISDQDK